MCCECQRVCTCVCVCNYVCTVCTGVYTCTILLCQWCIDVDYIQPFCCIEVGDNFSGCHSTEGSEIGQNANALAGILCV